MTTIRHAAIAHPAVAYSQDRRWESPETRTFAVFDGLSGKPDGDTAADIACAQLALLLHADLLREGLILVGNQLQQKFGRVTKSDELSAARDRMTDGSIRSRHDDVTAIVVDIL